MTNTKRNNNEKQKYFMFHIIQDMIISEQWTVDYYGYLVRKFIEFYPKETELIDHLRDNLMTFKNKISSDKNKNC